jgi:hypothetical protein
MSLTFRGWTGTVGQDSGGTGEWVPSWLSIEGSRGTEGNDLDSEIDERANKSNERARHKKSNNLGSGMKERGNNCNNPKTDVFSPHESPLPFIPFLLSNSGIFRFADVTTHFTFVGKSIVYCFLP